MSKIVILGSGLTGLSASYHFQQNPNIEIKIFAKESNAGGLCRSVHHDGFTFDYTGHLLHVSNSYFESFLKNLIPEENLNKINRNSFIYTHNRFVPYAFQMHLPLLNH